MKIENTTTSRSYIISQKELIEKLGLKGYIQSITLWSGLPVGQEYNDEDLDNVEYEIVTHEYEDENNE